MIDLRLPNINSTTEAGQLQQIRTYLYQFAEQMQWALAAVESGNTDENVLPQGTGSSSPISSAEEKATNNFNEIKSLIIKSADIVEAYAEKIDSILDLSGTYAAIDDFGDEGVAAYVQNTNQRIDATDKNITANYTNLQQIIGELGQHVNEIDTRAYLKAGELYTTDDGRPVYGLEIGQTDEFDGEEVFNRFARFTSSRLSFFNESGTEIAYMSGQTLHIMEAKIETLYLGRLTDTEEAFEGYKVDTTNGLEFKWIGGGN